MRDAFVKALIEEGKKDSNIILVTGDLGYGVLDEFQQELPSQFINSGVNEQTMMGMAAGIASTGKRVFVYSIGNFPTLRCLEQIRNDVCLMNNPVVIVSVGAGYAYGPQGYTHHALEDISVTRALHNLDVIAPADPIETRQITKLLCKTKSPTYLRLGRSNEIQLVNNDYSLVENKVNEIRQGEDGTLLFIGSIGSIALEAHEILKSEGIDVSVASSPFISHPDINYLKDAIGKGPLVAIEEHGLRGGFGSSILEALYNTERSPAIGLIGSKCKDLSLVGSRDFLLEANDLTTKEVVRKFKSLMES